MALRLDDHASRVLPGCGSIPERIEATSGLRGLCKGFDGPLKNGFRSLFEDGVGGQSEGRTHVGRGGGPLEISNLKSQISKRSRGRYGYGS